MGGDTPYDAEAARRLGLPCVAVLTGGFAARQLREAGAAAVYPDTADVLVHLDAVLGGATSPPPAANHPLPD